MKGIVLEPEGKPMRSRPSKETPKEKDEVLLGVFYTGSSNCVFKVERKVAEAAIKQTATFIGKKNYQAILLEGAGCFVVNGDLRSVSILDEDILLSDD